MIWPQPVVQLSKAGTCSTNLGSDLIIYASILWEKAAQVAKRLHSLQLFITDRNDRIVRGAAYMPLAEASLGFLLCWWWGHAALPKSLRMLCSMSLVWAISVQSSAKSSSRRSIKDTLVRAFRRWRLKIPPSLLNLIITIVTVLEGILEHCREDDTKEQ